MSELHLEFLHRIVFGIKQMLECFNNSKMNAEANAVLDYVMQSCSI
jgi:hypothetical protein